MKHKLHERESDNFGQLQRWIDTIPFAEKKMYENEEVIDVESNYTIFINPRTKGGKLFTLQIHHKIYELKDKMPPETILQ